jgi:3-isopropylmalate dehydratase small subunit
MQVFETLTGVAAPMLADDVNTDQIAPVAHVLHPDYGAQLFRGQRIRPDGSEEPGFVLNRPQFRQAAILVTGRNFGCGSSREAAVWGMLAVGIRCIVARSFADSFRENCLQNGVLPLILDPADQAAFEQQVVAVDGARTFTVDLRSQTVACPDGQALRFELPAADRLRLLEGLDEIGLTLKHAQAIAQWEARARAAAPWLQGPRDRRNA